LENVKHLIYHDNKKTFRIILDSLSNLGYKVSYKILNSINFGLPQNRERIFIVASKNRFFDFDKIEYKEKVILRDFLDKTGDFEYLSSNEYTIIENPKKQ